MRNRNVDPTTREVQHLSYVEARKKIYAPLYAKTPGYQTLKTLVASHPPTTRDFDGYNAGSKTFFEVLDDPNKKMGHAFVLARLLEMGV